MVDPECQPRNGGLEFSGAAAHGSQGRRRQEVELAEPGYGSSYGRPSRGYGGGEESYRGGGYGVPDDGRGYGDELAAPPAYGGRGGYADDSGDDGGGQRRGSAAVRAALPTHVANIDYPQA